MPRQQKTEQLSQQTLFLGRVDYYTIERWEVEETLWHFFELEWRQECRPANILLARGRPANILLARPTKATTTLSSRYEHFFANAFLRTR
jgi:hypothetical protein